MRKYLVKKGFTLIELVISIFISILIFSLLGSIFNISLKSLKSSNKKTENINNTYLAFELIKNEIENADYIIKNKNKNSLGFLIVSEMTKEKNKCTFYTLEDNKVFRNTQNSNKNYIDSEIVQGKFGKNALIENVENIEISLEKGLIKINILLNQKSFNQSFERKFAVRTNL